MATTAQRTDYLKGFQTLDREVRLDSVPVTGELPPWLAGTLVRTGPAQFEAGETRLRHWFDGQAMLHAFGFGEGRVSYANRWLRGRQRRHIEETGRIGYSEFATDPCRSLFARVTTMFAPGLTDNANVNVTRLGERFVAMTETPIPVEFDARTLQTAGVAWKPPGQLTTAHPHHDPRTGELVNYAARLGPRSHYRFFALDPGGSQRELASHAVRHPAYVHSFGITDRWLILAEIPWVVDPLRLALSGRPYAENYRWEPERGTGLLVFDRASGRLHRRYETDPFFCFHHVNAFERDGELVVDLCAFPDASIVDALYLDNLRAAGPVPRPDLRCHVLDLDGGGVAAETIAEDFELPRIAYRTRNGRPYRYAYGTAAGEQEFLGSLRKVDVETREAARWHEEGAYAGEPFFVPAPEGEAEDEGVLLSVALDAASGTSFLLVLDAGDLSEVARAHVPHHIPFSFHGQYFS